MSEVYGVGRKCYKTVCYHVFIMFLVPKPENSKISQNLPNHVFMNISRTERPRESWLVSIQQQSLTLQFGTHLVQKTYQLEKLTVLMSNSEIEHVIRIWVAPLDTAHRKLQAKSSKAQLATFPDQQTRVSPSNTGLTSIPAWKNLVNLHSCIAKLSKLSLQPNKMRKLTFQPHKMSKLTFLPSNDQ